MSGLGREWVALLGGVLFVARVLHAIGLSRSAGVSFGRMWGTLGTWSVILAASCIAIARAATALLMSS